LADHPDPTPAMPPEPTPIPVARPVTDYQPVAIAAPVSPPGFGEGLSALRAAVELLTMLLVFFISQVAVVAILYIIAPREAHRLINVIGSVGLGSAMTGAVLIMLRVSSLSRITIGLHSKSPAADIGVALIATLLIFGFLAIITVLIRILSPALYEQMTATQQSIEEAFPRMSPSQLIALCCWIGFYEELIFRGFLLTRLKAILRSWPLAVISGAILFALPHAYEGVFGMVAILFLGISLGILFVWRRSLLPVIIVHFLFNSLQFLQLYYLSDSWK